MQRWSPIGTSQRLHLSKQSKTLGSDTSVYALSQRAPFPSELIHNNSSKIVNLRQAAAQQPDQAPDTTVDQRSTTMQQPQGPAPPQQLLHYTAVPAPGGQGTARFLGGGAFGEVYQFRDTNTNELVAIKRVPLTGLQANIAEQQLHALPRE